MPIIERNHRKDFKKLSRQDQQKVIEYLKTTSPVLLCHFLIF